MQHKGTVLKYEIFNVLRSKWLYAYLVALALCTLGSIRVVEDPRKSELALINVVGMLVPLVSTLFCTTYWYSSERFTELLLSQPVSRRRLFWSRVIALISSLGFCAIAGVGLPAVLLGMHDMGLVWLLLSILFLSAVFCFIGAAVATFVQDRMWGIGLGLGIWFYTEILHDGILLSLLIGFREYPLDLPITLACALNPVGLTRVTMLMIFDAPLLLGHSGALLRRLVESDRGLVLVGIIGLFWMISPVLVAWRRFSKRDF